MGGFGQPGGIRKSRWVEESPVKTVIISSKTTEQFTLAGEGEIISSKPFLKSGIKPINAGGLYWWSAEVVGNSGPV